MPAITVLMSVYNGERWLTESIQSILRQSFTDFEFVIVNDGSNDRSLEIINEFAKIDSRIRVFNKPNSGLADSLNYGISLAQGEWIARIDADDVCDTERLKKQIAYIKCNTDLLLVGTGLVLIDEYGRHGGIYLYPSGHGNLKRRLSRAAPFFPHSSTLFNTAAVRDLGGYRLRLQRSQDQDLWLRLAEKGRIGCISEPLVYVRKHDEQISNDKVGQRQHVYSYVAMTSYWLRTMRESDPVDSNADQDFTDFQNWISIKLEDKNYLDYQKNVNQLKAYLQEAKVSYSTFFRMTYFILTSPYLVFRIIAHRIYGSGYSKKIASKWVKQRP